MTAHSTDDIDEPSPTDSFTDPETLRERDDVEVHRDAEVVDRETFEVVDDLDHVAVVGVTNDDDEVLLMRVTDDCDLKLPTPSVAPGEDYAEAAREWVAEQAGLRIELDALEAAWRYEARHADEDRATERYFVVYGASPASDGEVGTGEAEAAGWYDDLPDGATPAPGTDLFFA